MDLTALISVLAFFLFLGGAQLALYRQSGGRQFSPLWMAFSFTAGAALFLVAGLLGYNLSRHPRSVNGTAWTDGVIWSEVLVGAAMAAVAAVGWVRGLRGAR